jgi:uncharacterized cupredoxin-like copper-binding protein
MNARPIAATALAVLAAGQLVAYGVLSGQPNAGLMAVAVLPLLAIGLLWTKSRWGLVITTLVAAAAIVGVRVGDLSFDLVRPGSLGPFAVAVVQLLAAGVAMGATVVHARLTGPRIGLGSGIALGVAAGLAIVLAMPQPDGTGRLAPHQLAALPTVTMINYRFEPAQLRVPDGRPVAFKFVNTSDGDHDFVIDQLDIHVSVPSGRTRVAVVDVPPGTYALHCSVGDHKDSGMVGRLMVAGTQHHHGS